MITSPRFHFRTPADLEGLAFIEGVDAHAILDELERAESLQMQRLKEKQKG